MAGAPSAGNQGYSQLTLNVRPMVIAPSSQCQCPRLSSTATPVAFANMQIVASCGLVTMECERVPTGAVV